MTPQLLNILSIILIVLCAILSLVFLVIPLPKYNGLNEYRNSLKLLSISYLILAICTSVMKTDFFSFTFIAASNTQLILFVLTHIVLVNPKKINIKYVFTSTIPLSTFILLNISFSFIWDEPEINNWTDWRANILHPIIVLRQLFLLTYIAQLIYATLLFFNELRLFKNKLDAYYTEHFTPSIKWLKISFLSALFIGVFVILATLSPSIEVNIIFELITIIFYSGYGLLFIQYPRLYPIISAILVEPISNKKNSNQMAWDDIKNNIINKQLHLKQGVTIEEIATQLKTSRSTLSSIINKEAGMNFNSWINDLRIEDAKRYMLDNPTHTIAQIAEMVGYSEASNFSRQFKISTQYSPLQWRQQQLN